MDVKKPLFVLGLVLIAAAVLVELGATAIVGSSKHGADAARALDAPQPGWGIPCLAFIDGLVLLTLLLMGLTILRPQIASRIQGAVTLVASLLALIGAILLIFGALALLCIMVALFLAVPFGTIAYGIVWGSFDRAGAGVALSLIMILKVAAAFCLLLAHPSYLRNKSLVVLMLTSLVANIVVSFLHGFVPGFLVSITDMVAAIILMILGAVWALWFLIQSIKAVWRAFKKSPATA